MIICPIDKFGEYFEVSAKFRIKNSGSTEPSSKYVDDIIAFLKERYNINVYKKTVNGKKKLFAHAPANFSKVKFKLDKYTYYLSPQTEGYFEVKQLSNTRNKNVIFSINVKQEQLESDLEQFKSELL